MKASEAIVVLVTREAAMWLGQDEVVHRTGILTNAEMIYEEQDRNGYMVIRGRHVSDAAAEQAAKEI